MRNDNDFFIDNDEVEVLISRYRKMLNDNRLAYFDVDEFIGIISYFQNEGKINSAHRAVKIALSQHPGAIELKLKEAQVLFDNGRIMESLHILKQLSKIEKNNPEIFQLKGIIYSVINKIDLAIEQFDLCLQCAGDDISDFIYSTAIALETAGYYTHAVKYFEDALIHSPDNHLLYYDIAFCCEKTEDYKKSEHYFKLYLEEEPFSENAWYNLGVVYNAIEKYKEALDAYDFALAIDDEYTDAIFNKANTLANIEQYSEAIQLYQECLSLEQETEELFYNRML